MKITKLVNNNIVTSEDMQGREIIVMGRGLGFGKKPGMEIDVGKIEKVFRLSSEGENQKLVDIIQDIPIEHITAADRIIDYAKSMLGEKLKDTIYLSLIDHINGAIERQKNQITFTNPLMWEIKQYYPAEFSVGVQSLSILKNILGITLPVDEAAFIALHFITSEYDTKMDVTFDIPKLIDDIVAILESEFEIQIDKNSIHYERFITHLKFFAARVLQAKQIPEEGDFLFRSMIRDQYKESYECAKKIKQHIEEAYGVEISEEEVVYLTVHIKRVTMKNQYGREDRMKDQIFGVLQKVGRSFMLPIAVLPVAGLLLGIGSSFTNATMIETYGLQAILGEGTFLNMFLLVLSKAGSALFDNLPLIFAVGCAIGMASREKEVAALSAVIAYFAMNASINAMLINTGKILEDGSIAENVLSGTIASSVGIQTLQMGVFGGILVGLGVAVLHNRFHAIELPSALAFFSGSRFVPIISTVVYTFVGILMFFVWPTVQTGIYALGGLVTGTGYFGTLIFGIIKRALIPFGLHHVFYLPFWQTGVGGSMEVAGKMIEGGQNIFFAQLADPSTTHFSADACRYFSGEFIFMIFGLPGAALAMYQTAKPEKKKQAGGLLLSAALACMATGITEPLEFSFLFVAPMLFAVQVILAGAAYMIAHMLNIAVGLTFSGGLLDFFLFGIMQGNAKTSWMRVIPVGIIYFLLYYLIFRFLIVKFNLKTPGREEDDTETKLYTKADYKAAKNSGVKGAETSALIVAGLGGKANIAEVDCCATRLRCTIVDPEKVSQPLLKQSGSRGVILKGKGIQVIYGPQVAVLKTNLEAFLLTPEADTIKTEDFLGQAPEKKEESVVKKSVAEPVSSEFGKNQEIATPITGTVMPLSEVSDAVFSSEMLGKGFGVEPEEGKAYAPVNGEVTTVFDTMHAIGLQGEDGVELLIHIGMDTVKLNGKGFDVKVKAGDHVKAGDLLVEFDMDLIRKEGYPVTTAVVVTNTDTYKEVALSKNGKTEHGENVLTVTG